MDSCPLLFEAVCTDLSGSYSEVPSYDRIPHIPIVLDARLVAASSLRASITKKYIPSDPRTLQQTQGEAYSLFLRMNERCSVTGFDASLAREMRLIAERDFCDIYDWQDLLRSYGLIAGSGASVGSRGQNTCFEKFFVNDLTTTNPWLYCEYSHYIQEHATFYTAEKNRRYMRGRAFKLVDGSTMTTVPKNDRIDRTICTEPSLNMVFQRALGEHLNAILRQVYGYDPALQPDRNRRLARVGSLTSCVGTIDLSSASDTISYDLCQAVLPKWLCIAIDDCRCQKISLNGQYMPLHMVSTMGNGFTFPLQTYIFSLLVRAVAYRADKKFVRYNDPRSFYGVFGDDIIVPSDLFDATIDGLVSLGFIPNESKSFNHGVFRESCGTDWYNGVDVRGVYCKALHTINDRFSLLNRLLRFSARHAISLRNTCLFVRPPSWTRYTVPSDVSDSLGVHTPESYAPRRFTKNGCFRYRCFSPQRKIFRLWFKDQLLRSHYNPLGIMIAACVSSVSEGLDRRSKPVRYRVINAHAPFWVRQCDFARHSLILVDWETAFAENMA